MCVFKVFFIKINVVVCKFKVIVWWIKKFLGFIVKKSELLFLLIVFNYWGNYRVWFVLKVGLYIPDKSILNLYVVLLWVDCIYWVNIGLIKICFFGVLKVSMMLLWI